MLQNFTINIAKKFLKEEDKYILDVTDNVFSVYDFLKNFKFILIKYISLYVLFLIFIFIILPGIVFYFATFALSVLTFFISTVLSIYITVKIMKKISIILKQEVDKLISINKIYQDFQNKK